MDRDKEPKSGSYKRTWNIKKAFDTYYYNTCIITLTWSFCHHHVKSTCIYSKILYHNKNTNTVIRHKFIIYLSCLFFQKVMYVVIPFNVDLWIRYTNTISLSLSLFRSVHDTSSTSQVTVLLNYLLDCFVHVFRDHCYIWYILPVLSYVSAEWY